MKGFFLDKGFEYYTYMNFILKPIEDYVMSKNWLISDYECNDYLDKIPFEKEYVFLSGEIKAVDS